MRDWAAKSASIFIGHFIVQCAALMGGGSSAWAADAPPPAEIPPPGPPLAKPETPVFPVPYAARPLTFPKGMIAPELALLVYRQPLLYDRIDFGNGNRDKPVFSEPRLSLRVGVTNNFQFDVNVFSFQMVPEAVFTNPELALTFRFARGTVDAGVRVHSILPLQDKTSPALGVGFPVVVHWGRLRVDSGLQVLFVFDRYGKIRGEIAPPAFAEIRDGRLEAGLPVEVNIQIMDSFSLGANTGVMLPMPDHSEVIYFPLGFRAGFTVAQNDRPIVDIDSRFELQHLGAMGAEGEGPDGAFYFGFAVKTFFML